MAKRKTKSNALVQLIAGIVIILVITWIGGKYDSNLLENLKGSLESESLEDVEKNNDNSTQKIETSKVDGNLIVDFIDQTTPNMIQRISGIFERNPLISKEI